ncbi:hypothetical protein CDAR_523221 [Caerostris darwini]|uniref:Uncharacterized protein n=1 Tax=Caerostris darwini TaxID=1538125 RepID=A0AAV4U944_9ARAC|nr:hypothetical protein CDAR_523221 [Caerostris darwini]
MMSFLFLSYLLQGVHSIPFSSPMSELLSVKNSSQSPTDLVVTTNSTQFIKINSVGHDIKIFNAQDNKVHDLKENAEKDHGIVADKKSIGNSLIRNVTVTYVCDTGKRTCWLDRKNAKLDTFDIPFWITLRDLHPKRMNLKDFYSLAWKERGQFPFDLDEKPESLKTSPSKHNTPRRRKREVESFEDVDSNEDGADQNDNDVDQSQRNERDAESSTPGDHTSPSDANKNSSSTGNKQQKKRSTYLDDYDEDIKPTPEDETDSNNYDDEEEDDKYQIDKRVAGPVTDGASSTDSSTAKPAAIQFRRNIGQPYNPYFQADLPQDPYMYYQPERRFSRFDGISNRSPQPNSRMYYQPDDDETPYNYAAPSYHKMQRMFGRLNNPYGYGSHRRPSYQNNANMYYGSDTKPAKSPYYNYGPHHNYGKQPYRKPYRKPVETSASMYYGK